jgi:hypothetical protein
MNLEELVGRATSKRSAQHCWVTRLEGDAAAFVAALEELDVSKPGRVNRTEVARIMKSEFGVPISEGAVKYHFQRNCRCGR